MDKSICTFCPIAKECAKGSPLCSKELFKAICAECSTNGSCPNQIEGVPQTMCTQIDRAIIGFGASLERALMTNPPKNPGETERKTPAKKLVKLQSGNQTYTFSRSEDIDEGFREACLKTLNENFRATSLEQYNEAMMSVALKEGLEKYGHGKERLSLHQYARVQKHMIHRLRLRYGPYINVFRKKDRFGCNLKDCYKTDMGRLYNSMGIRNLFVTTHAIERFEERTVAFDDTPFIIKTRMDYQKSSGTNPTAWDLMEDQLNHAYQYTRTGNNMHVNLGVGVLAVDMLPNMVCIGKTFLTPDMAPKTGWREDPEEYLIILNDLIDEFCVPCQPVFWSPEENA